MRRILLIGVLGLGLLALPSSSGWGQTVPGGGGDGSGVDILPGLQSWQWHYDSPGGGRIEVRGGCPSGPVDLSIDKGRANGHVTPVIVSGTIGGVFVSGSGRLVSDGDGNQRLRGDEGDPGLRLTRYEQPHWGGFKLFGLFDPDEYGDGNPYDDIGGRIEDYSPGCPIGSGVITY
jgi:hypothetical protein